MKKVKYGFTLIELLIVITIIGIMMGFGTYSFSNIQKSARDARRKTDLKAVQNALEQFYARNSTYPSTNGAWRGICANYNPTGTFTDTGANGYIPNLAPEFMPFLPRDPRESQRGNLTGCNPIAACYIYRSNGIDYKMMAYCSVETRINATDPLRDPRRPTWVYAVYSSAVAGNGW